MVKKKKKLIKIADKSFNILDKYAPMKKKYLSANHVTLMTKEIRKVTIIRSKLKNKSLKDKNEQSRHDYRKQCNLFAVLVRRAKQQYFSSLDLRLIADNKKFWKRGKPIFSEKISIEDIISLTEDGKIITEDLQIAAIFNNYFSSTTEMFPQNQAWLTLKKQFLKQSINSEIIPASFSVQKNMWE